MMITFPLLKRAGLNIKKIANCLLVIVFTLSFASADAKKSYYPFEILIGMSDVIVTGQISGVSGDTSYLFTISESIKGKTARQIQVKIFENWTCDSRWKKAATGQQLFLFLKKTNNRYEIIGGSDGEIFVVDNKLRLVNIFSFNRTSPYISQYFNESTYPELSDVISAVRSFASCYLLTNTQYPPYTFRQIKAEQEISVMKNMNSFSVWLFGNVTDDMKRYKLIKPSQELMSANIVLPKTRLTEQ